MAYKKNQFYHIYVLFLKSIQTNLRLAFVQNESNETLWTTTELEISPNGLRSDCWTTQKQKHGVTGVKRWRDVKD